MRFRGDGQPLEILPGQRGTLRRVGEEPVSTTPEPCAHTPLGPKATSATTPPC